MSHAIARWKKDPLALIKNPESCVKPYGVYQEQYRATKETLPSLPKGKQFDLRQLVATSWASPWTS
eukprot:6128676-Lingulodinium_polyedra.AAC.1